MKPEPTAIWLPEAGEAPRLAGARISLGAPRAADADGLYAFMSDAAAMRYWSSPLLLERTEAEAKIADWQRGFAAREFIGSTSLFRLDVAQQRCELGDGVLPRLWGMGLGCEAVRLTLAFAFDRLGMRRIEADVDPRNLASCRLLERVGFRREGLLRERWHVRDEFQDTALYGLLAREFSP
jgi:RimJ/RimL family protein N-acetyltransferase